MVYGCNKEENLHHIISECDNLKDLRDLHDINMKIDDFFERRHNDSDFSEKSNWYLKDIYERSFQS